MHRARSTRTWLTIAALITCARVASAQELEPRAYSASPVGATFLVVIASRSSGSVFLDPSLPVQDVKAKLGAVTVGTGNTFDLFTRTALATVAVPYARGTASGRIQETTAEITRAGWADMRLKLSVNLVGGRAMRLAEFARQPRSTIVGVSIAAIAPTGTYDSHHLINVGSHRWSYKPEVGVSVPIRRWTLDGYVGVWLFGANDHFYPGEVRRTQDPITAIQGHVSYTIRSRFWLAFDSTWYSGGTTSLDGVPKSDLQRNSRAGISASLPLGKRQSIKVGYSTGATTRIGGDFDTISIGWQMTWIRK